MTNIIDMAREAGFVSAAYWPNEFRGLHDCVERFAALHRAAIIAELCAGVEMPEPVAVVCSFNDLGGVYDLVSPPKYRPPVGTPLVTLDQMREAVASAVVKERELCAKVCDGLANNVMNQNNIAIRERKLCANVIRARSDKV